MRVKTFSAASMSKAMQLVRAEMGEDALILSSETFGDGVRLVAAVETPEPEEDVADWAGSDGSRTGAGNDGSPLGGRPPEPAPAAAVSRGAPPGLLRDVLAWHGVAPSLALRLQSAARASGESDPAAALAVALQRTFEFRFVDDEPPSRPLMLVGPSGAGKTLAAAKLIVDAHRAGRTVVAASCDTRRAGGVEQLRAFTRILDIPLALIDGPDALRGLAGAAGSALVVVDTAGTCPWVADETEELVQLIDAAQGEPVLVTAAASDAAEAAETAAAFARLGCRRMFATRLDVSRRLGALLAAAGGGLTLAGAAIGPEAADPLAPVEPVPLARLMLANALRGPAAPRRRPVPDPAEPAPPQSAAPESTAPESAPPESASPGPASAAPASTAKTAEQIADRPASPSRKAPR